MAATAPKPGPEIPLDRPIVAEMLGGNAQAIVFLADVLAETFYIRDEKGIERAVRRYAHRGFERAALKYIEGPTAAFRESHPGRIGLTTLKHGFETIVGVERLAAFRGADPRPVDHFFRTETVEAPSFVAHPAAWRWMEPEPGVMVGFYDARWAEIEPEPEPPKK